MSVQGSSLSVVCQGDCHQSKENHWVLQVCGLWHLETSVLATAACAAVDGVEAVRADRWNLPCAVCRSRQGAVIRCNAGHCATAFHPLCARNNGQHLAAREGSAGKTVYRAYCALHSNAQREKDLDSASQVQQFIWWEISCSCLSLQWVVENEASSMSYTDRYHSVNM